MKKKIVIIGTVCVMTVIGVGLLKSLSLADSGNIMSEGIFTLQDGSDMTIDAEDFQYLQSEIGSLFGELPRRNSVSSNELED